MSDENPDIKRWRKEYEYDPFEGQPSFKECRVCREATPKEQFVDNEELSSSICNTCLARWKMNTQLLAKFVAWSKTGSRYRESKGHLTAIMFSGYSVPDIETAVLSAIVNSSKRQDLVKTLIILAGDAGDQLLLAECIEELNQLQDETK